MFGEQSKVCSACKGRKLLSEFHLDPHSPDGVGYRCKECKNAINRARPRFCRQLSESDKSRKREYNVRYRLAHGRRPRSSLGSVDWVVSQRLVDAWIGGKNAAVQHAKVSAGTRWVAYCTWSAMGYVSASDDVAAVVRRARALGVAHGWRRMTVNDVIASLADVAYLDNQLLERV